MDLLIGSGMSILSYGALRLITQNKLEQILDGYKNKNKDGINSLCTNANQRKSQDFLQRTLMAAFLLRCLQKSGYFNNDRDDGKLLTFYHFFLWMTFFTVIPTENEYIIGELLLFYLQILQFNAHEIYESVYTEHKFRNCKALYIGIAIYPTVSLFNHDCYPSVIR